MEDGIKSFPFPVKLDDKVRLIEAEFGIAGYAVVWKLHQAIYSVGYYLKWDIDTQLLFIEDYHLSKVGRNVVSEIVTCCLRRGVFESTSFEKYNILTSERIQETFLTAKARSTKVIMEKSYALPIVYTFIENVSKKGKNVNIFLKNADIFDIKERKGKNLSLNNACVCACEEEELKARIAESDFLQQMPDSWIQANKAKVLAGKYKTFKKPTDKQSGVHFKNERTYTQERLDAVITDVDDIEI